MPISNSTMQTHTFLTEMYGDDYFPDFLVDKCKQILVSLCEQIESTKPSDNESLLRLTHAAVDSLNQLEAEFEENESEIETAARDALGDEFHAILHAYGFGEVEVDDAIANRDW